MTQKGVANTFLLLVLLAVVALGIIFMVKRTATVNDGVQPMYTEPAETFESMGDDEDVPEEVNNESIEEMDKIFVEIEKSAPSEDFSDINY